MLIFILISGLIIRLILSAISFHPDIVHFDLAGYVLGKGNLINFYDYTYSLKAEDELLKKYPVDLFNYPPAIYFSVGVLDWLLTSFADINFHNNFLFNFQNTLGDLRLNLHLSMLKIPYLPFDFLIAYLLFNLYHRPREKILALTLWVFNPWVLYSTYMIGQFDVIPTALVVLAIYTLHKSIKTERAVFLASFILGIGASLKIYPLLFLFPLALVLNQWSKRILAILLGCAVYLLTILPFIASSGFRSTALAAKQTLKSLYAQIPISGGESIILFLFFVGFFYLIFLYHKEKTDHLWQRFFIILLLFFSFTHYHPQWFLWLTPFLIMELVSNNFKHIFLLGLFGISFLGLIFLFDQSLSIGLFAPINRELYQGPTLWQLLRIKVDTTFLRSLLQTLFVCGAGYLIYYYFPTKKYAKE